MCSIKMLFLEGVVRHKEMHRNAGSFLLAQLATNKNTGANTTDADMTACMQCDCVTAQSTAGQSKWTRVDCC